jgi:hypothetical protein
MHSYEGSWAKDQWHGRGVLYLAGGGRYEGEFRRGKKEGEGKLFDANNNLM